MSQEKLETMLMQNLKGQRKSIMVFSEVAYCELLRLYKKSPEDTVGNRHSSELT